MLVSIDDPGPTMVLSRLQKILGLTEFYLPTYTISLPGLVRVKRDSIATAIYGRSSP